MSTSLSTSAAPERRQWFSLAVLSLSLGIIVIDTSIVAVTVKAITDVFHASVPDIQWISASYALVYAALLIAFGRVGDIVGRRRIFVLGTATFMLGSLVVGLSPTIGVMILGRLIQGLGAAMASPSTLSILSVTFTGRSRSIAFAIWGSTAGAAGALGPLLGGYFVTFLTWRWAFLINLPIGLVVILGSLLYVDESKDALSRHAFDILGTFLAAVGLAALVFGFIEASTYGWWQPRANFSLGPFTWDTSHPFAVSPLAWTIALAALLLFAGAEWILERRGGDPVFRLSLLRFPAFRFGLLTVTVVALGEFGILTILSLYFQEVRGLTALNTGLVLLSLALGSFITAPVAGRLTARFGPKYVVTTGMVGEAAAIFLISRVTTETTPLSVFVLVFLLYGLGLGLAIAQLANIVMSDIPPQFAGIGAGVNSMLRQVGAAIGIAILGAILTAQISASVQASLPSATNVPPFIKMEVQQGIDQGLPKDVELAIVDSTITDYNARQPSERLIDKSAVHAAVAHLLDHATTQGTRDTSLAAALFVLLGALCSLFIPRHEHP